MIGSAEWSRKTDPCGNRHRAGLTGYHLWCPCPDLTRYRLTFVLRASPQSCRHQASGVILGPSAWRWYEASNYIRSCGMRIGRWFFAAMKGSGHEGFFHPRRHRHHCYRLWVQGAPRQILHARKQNHRGLRDGQGRKKVGLQKVRRRSRGLSCKSRRVDTARGAG